LGGKPPDLIRTANNAIWQAPPEWTKVDTSRGQEHKSINGAQSVGVKIRRRRVLVRATADGKCNKKEERKADTATVISAKKEFTKNKQWRAITEKEATMTEGDSDLW